MFLFLLNLLIVFSARSDIEFNPVGLWKGEDGQRVIIPYLRNTTVPLLYALPGEELKPHWGTWNGLTNELDIQIEGLQMHLKGTERRPVLVSPKGAIPLTLLQEIELDHPFVGGWSINETDEVTLIPLKQKIYVIHKDRQSRTAFAEGKWLDNGIRFRVKLTKKCTVELLSNQRNLATAKCGRTTSNWTRSFVPVPFKIHTLDGEWYSGTKLLRLALTNNQWESAELEEGSRIEVYKPEWAGGFEGSKFYLRNPQDDSVAIGHLREQEIVLNLSGKTYIFTKR